MSRESILIVEDEEDILELISYNLTKEGYQITTALTGEDGLKIAQEKHPALVVLDLMLPGIDGLEVCARLKNSAQTRDIAVVILTAKGEEADIVTGLELGADDYMTKPFSPRILLARIRAVLRCKEAPAEPEDAALQIHDLTIHPGRREVLHNKKLISLTFTEFGLLHMLARRPGWVFTRHQIIDGVRGEDHIVTDRSVDVQVTGLRKKLGVAGRYIETVRGVGYRFRE